MDRAFGQAGPRGDSAARRPSSRQSSRVAILKSTQEEGGVAKSGDVVDAMTRLLGGEGSTEEGEEMRRHRPQESV